MEKFSVLMSTLLLYANPTVIMPLGVFKSVPGGEAVGKCRVKWGMEVGVPGREAMGDHWEYVREVSPRLIGFRKTNILPRK